MRLRRLSIDRLPGLRTGFELDGLSPGLNVIIGPNGSGKTSLCRAVRALLWEEEPFRGGVRSEWEQGGGIVAIDRETGTPPLLEPLDGATASPALPEGRFRRCFTLSIDDFLTDRETEGEIAREIRKELAAGFDLSAVLADRRGRSAQSGGAPQRAAALRAAERERRVVQAAHRELAEEEGRLQELRELRGVAAAAIRTAPRARDAVDLAEARRQAREARARLEGFPPGARRLRGDELGRLADLRESIEESERELARARREAMEACSALEDAALEAPVPAEDLATLSTREELMRSLEQELERAREAEAGAAGALTEANRMIGTALQGGAPPELGRDRWSEIEAALRELEACRARRIALLAEVGEVADVDPEATDPPYEKGIHALARWLESGSGAGAGARALLGLGPAIAAGALLFVAGVATLVFGSGTGWLLAIAGAGLLAYGAWDRRHRTSDQRPHWEREFEELGFAPPSAWVTDEVVNALARMQREHAAHAGRAFQRRYAEERRARLTRVEAEEREERARFEARCAAMGITAGTATLGVMELAAKLFVRTEASDEFARAQAKRLEAQAALGRERDRARELLGHHGEPGATDSTELAQRRESLAARERARGAAEATIERAREETVRHAAQLDRRRTQRRALFEELGLADGDELELARLVDQHADWQEANAELERAELTIRTLEARLADRPELRSASVEEARRLEEEKREQGARQESLTAEIARIEAEVKRTRQGHDLEDALAAEELAREALKEVREELYESATADFLVEAIASEHRDQAHPGILVRAAERFGRFTRHRYRLSAGGVLEEGPGFEIRETDGGAKALSELSGGTLSQLCLALRLAVAEGVERDEVLPIFVDEALTNSDPVRFREVALALGELVREGRQVFFLTADPDDAVRLEDCLVELELDPPGRYDLAELRGERAAAPRLSRAPLPEVPEPLPGEDAAAYGERLRVPAIDPFLGVDALHAFFLSSDDLGALHRVLAERVETVGQVRELLAVHPRPIWGEATTRRFQALRAVAAVWLEAYCTGRGPRFHRETLEEGPAGRTKFLDVLLEIAAEQEWDAGRFLAVLEAEERDDRLKRFKSATTEALRDDLEEGGYYSPLDPLSSEELLERALTAARSGIEDGTITREDVHQLANAFEAWLGA